MGGQHEQRRLLDQRPGATNTTLTLTRPEFALNGNLYRAQFTAGSCSGPTSSALLTVARKNLTIDGAVANSKTYDGNDDATVDFTLATLQGVESGDTVTINSSGYEANFNNKNVANGKPVTVTGVTLGGAHAPNYTVSQPSGLTANITQLNTTASFEANDKVYDGTTAATTSSRDGDEQGRERRCRAGRRTPRSTTRTSARARR